MAQGIKIKGLNGEPCQVESAIRDANGAVIQQAWIDSDGNLYTNSYGDGTMIDNAVKTKAQLNDIIVKILNGNFVTFSNSGNVPDVFERIFLIYHDQSMLGEEIDAIYCKFESSSKIYTFTHIGNHLYRLSITNK